MCVALIGGTLQFVFGAWDPTGEESASSVGGGGWEQGQKTRRPGEGALGDKTGQAVLEQLEPVWVEICQVLF